MKKRFGFRDGLAPIVLAIMVALGVSAAGIGGMLLYKNGGVQLANKTPEQIVSGSLANLLEAKSFAFNGEAAGTDGTGMSGSIKFNGATDFTNSESPKFSVVLNIDSGAGAERVAGSIEARFIEKAIYARLAIIKLPEDGFFAFVALFANQWIKFDIENSDQFVDADDAAKYEEYLKQNKKARDIFAKHLKSRNLIKVESEAGQEAIDGVATTQYVVYLDNNAIADALPQIYKDLEGAGFIDPERKISNEEMADAQARVRESETAKFNIWVDVKREELRKFAMMPSDENSRSAVAVSVIFKDYGKPIELEIPAGAKTFEEVFNQGMGGFDSDR